MPPGDTTPAHVRLRSWKRTQRLATLGYDSYAAYLASPHWRALRRRYAEQRPWICNTCGAEESLQLHHRTYDRVGDEHLDDLMPLCGECHDMVHALERRGDATLDFEGVIDITRALRNRQIRDKQRAAMQRETEDDRIAFAASLEQMPITERVDRLRMAARGSGAVNPLKALRGLKFRQQTPDTLMKHLRDAERRVYGI